MQDAIKIKLFLYKTRVFRYIFRCLLDIDCIRRRLLHITLDRDIEKHQFCFLPSAHRR